MGIVKLYCDLVWVWGWGDLTGFLILLFNNHLFGYFTFKAFKGKAGRGGKPSADQNAGALLFPRYKVGTRLSAGEDIEFHDLYSDVHFTQKAPEGCSRVVWSRSDNLVYNHGHAVCDWPHSRGHD